MRRILSATAFLFLLGFALPACTPKPADICEPKCDCEGCGSREFDNCVDDYLDDESRAANRRCLPEFDDYNACQEETWTCRGDDWDTDCNREKDRLKDCLD